MANALTENGSVECGHSPGAVALAGIGNPDLKGGGYNVITKTQLMAKTVVGCSHMMTNPAPPPAEIPGPCTVVSLITGESTKLTAGGDGAVLDSTTVKCISPDPEITPVTMNVSAGQDKLTASG